MPLGPVQQTERAVADRGSFFDGSPTSGSRGLTRSSTWREMSAYDGEGHGTVQKPC